MSRPSAITGIAPMRCSRSRRVASVSGPERVVIGVVGGFGASMQAPGYAHHNGMEFVRLGEALDAEGRHGERHVETIVEVG